MARCCRSVARLGLVLLILVPLCGAAGDERADTVLLGGRVLTMDAASRIVAAIAVRDGRVLATGADEEIREFIGDQTAVIELEGKTVIPGIIAAHCHAVGVARNELDQPYEQLLSIGEVQDWIRRRARSAQDGEWIRVPRADITRLKERRHPTVAELDAACDTHPVLFTAARKHAVNSRGLVAFGVSDETTASDGVEVLRDAAGNVRLLVIDDTRLQAVIPRSEHSAEQLLATLQEVHRRYNAVGITSIFERAGTIDDFLLYRRLHDERRLNVRMVQTFRSNFGSAAEVTRFVERLGMVTGDGDDWVRVGPLKIVVDGGIHWGNTYLREAYGTKRIKFYAHTDPEYRGVLHYSVDQMTELFRAGHRSGWQWCCHVTGDAGVDAVLDAVEAVQREQPEIAERRFSLTHAYFPARDAIARARQLGVCVDTQSSLYWNDSAAIAEVYGVDWAARFIGLGDWVRGGIPTAIAGDHMMGLDPEKSMNAYSPFLMLQVAVTRRNRQGDIYGERQKLDRLESLRCLTTYPAYLEFAEGSKGSLEAGKLADLAVLDRDYLSCPEQEIRQIKVVSTMVDGRFVHR